MRDSVKTHCKGDIRSSNTANIIVQTHDKTQVNYRLRVQAK